MYHVGEEARLQNQIIKRQWLLFGVRSLILSQITCSWARQQPCGHVVPETGPRGKGLKPEDKPVNEFGRPAQAESFVCNLMGYLQPKYPVKPHSDSSATRTVS